MKTPTQILDDACAAANLPKSDVLARRQLPRTVGVRAAVAIVAREHGWKWHAISAAFGMDRTASYKVAYRYARRMLTPVAMAQADAIVATMRGRA